MGITSRSVSVAAIFATLSACGGGGGGGIAFVPPPPSSPSTATPPPGQQPLSTPVANNSPALVPGMLTPSPARIEATSNSLGFSDLTGSTIFPILQTVATPGTFAGDANATAAGGTFDGYSLQLNVNSSAPWFSYTVAPEKTVTIDPDELDYTRFGSWVYWYPSEGPSFHGVWNTGFVTPFSALPTTGQASYAGRTSGFYDESHPCGCNNWTTVSFAGDMNMTANFGARTLSGSFTNLAITGGFVQGPGYEASLLPPKLNDVSFSASIDSARNWFSGNTSVTNQPVGPQAFTPDAAGSITGMFYGPVANEVGGVWTLSDSVRRLIGSFGGKQH